MASFLGTQAQGVIPEGYDAPQQRQQTVNDANRLGNDISETAGAGLVGLSNIPRGAFKYPAHLTNYALNKVGARSNKTYHDTRTGIENIANWSPGNVKQYSDYLSEKYPKTVLASEIAGSLSTFNPKSLQQLYTKVMPGIVSHTPQLSWEAAKAASKALGIGIPITKETQVEPFLDDVYAKAAR